MNSDPIFDSFFGHLAETDRVISGATHWDLVRTENQAYNRLLTENISLQLRYQDLSDRYSSHVNQYLVCCDFDDANHPLNSRSPTPDSDPPALSDLSSPSAIGGTSFQHPGPSILERVMAAIGKAREHASTDQPNTNPSRCSESEAGLERAEKLPSVLESPKAKDAAD
ncbi:hypothetical protein CPC08DRAFT_715694 [Agrocybe pediades]|nr:hypothetical protein CPC08DRAFT_715694 [Agrocybe pediades]